MQAKIALVTCAELPNLTEDGQALAQILAQANVEVSAVVWNDPSIDWTRFSGAIVRSTWDYHRHATNFETWLTQVSQPDSNFSSKQMTEINHGKIQVITA